MKITFVTGNWVSLSGGPRVVSIYAEYLHRCGHEVLVVCPKRRTPGIYEQIRSFLKGNGLISLNKKKGSHFDGLAVPRKVLKHKSPVTNHDVPDADVVIACWWETAEWVSALSDTKGAKVYFIQGHEVHSHLPVARCRATYYLPLHKIVIAKWLRDVMRTEYGDTVVDLVPNSVNHNQFFAELRGKQAVPTLGFLYSPVKLKGVDITLKAIDLLRERFPNLRVIAFGARTPERGSDFDSRIEFHHSPEQECIRDLYAQCDVWVTASRTEGFNLTAMEAMACRTPVVSTKTGWPEEAVVNGENGFLVDVDDVVALTECVASVFSRSDEDWRMMSQNAFDTVKKSSWQASANLFEKALQHACRRAKKGEIAGVCTCSLSD